MALAANALTPDEYATGVMACHAMLGEVFEISSRTHTRLFNELRDDARTALTYVTKYREGLADHALLELIKKGESTTLEFKSTFRFNLQAQRHDDAIKHATVKTVAAFLNSQGGTLLIGVADDGAIRGIKDDGYNSDDKFSLALHEALIAALGETAITLIDTSMIAIGSHTVCRLGCRASDTPVYCRTKTGARELYIRTGPGTRALPVDEVVDYVHRHFHQN
jgi:hypothetical protein